MSEPAPEVRIGKPHGVGAWVSRAVSAVVLAMAAAWLAGDRLWLADLAANFAAQWCVLGLVLAVWFAGWRRWGCVAACLLAAGLAFAPLRVGRIAPTGGTPDVRLLVVNTFVDSGRPDAAMELVLGSDADVLCVLEPSGALLDAMRASAELHERYPTLEIPDRAGAGWRVVMSRWPMTRLRQSRDDSITAHGKAWRIETPAGALVASVIHPESPRSAERWREGNGDVRTAIGWVNGRLAQENAPIVLFGDLNATPSGWRSRALFHEAGLRRAKPQWRARGTWPAAWSWPCAVAIDDALVSEGIGVTSWRAVRVGGSDHRAVEIGLALE